ncbi:helix-turn-helix domain-containing protein [Albibacterium profundi]|uniref:Helix-turn-helix transcriptional regulator n=1 Tax=Albibacterium profundi TaxID=3134906 RepID=A0ABV5CGA4_9SPHI
MKKPEDKIFTIHSITEIHKAFGLPKPKHPLISLINFNECKFFNPDNAPVYDVLDFYKIAFSTQSIGRLKYGQGYYDFDEGTMLFTAPHQLIGGVDYEGEIKGYILFIHPDFFQGYPLAKTIKDYGFFSYSVKEALHLSDSEKETLLSVYSIIEKELNNSIDEFSQDVLIAQLELLVSYANRFYKRQFVTRKKVNNDILAKTEALIDTYFSQTLSLEKGILSVHYLAEQLHLTPGYLSDMLRSLTGLNARQYIHLKLIDKAKERLSTTTLSVSEIAYELGFEHSQSFNKLFKKKTNKSPLEFRAEYN